MSALAAWQVTAMDITFMMQVQEMQKFIRTLTHDFLITVCHSKTMFSTHSKESDHDKGYKSLRYDQQYLKPKILIYHLNCIA
jgi:hypothetical protein